MPRTIKNDYGWTLRKLVQNTYHNMKSRYDYMERDVLKQIRIEKISVYNGMNPGEARTKYVIRSYSYPQYEPYYNGYDNRGRKRKYQRTYKHEYDVTIQMQTLSLDDDRIKLRTGSDCRWDFSKDGQGHWQGTGRNKHFMEGTNVRRGRNGDFFFRSEWLYQDQGILFGRCWADRPPIKANPNMVVFLDKHMLSVVKYLTDRGILQ